MNVQNQCFRYTAWLKRPNFWVYVSPGSAETLARGGEITNHHLIAYSLSNISAKKLPKSVNVRWSYSVLYIIVVFLRHGVVYMSVTSPSLWRQHYSYVFNISIGLDSMYPHTNQRDWNRGTRLRQLLQLLPDKDDDNNGTATVRNEEVFSVLSCLLLCWNDLLQALQ